LPRRAASPASAERLDGSPARSRPPTLFDVLRVEPTATQSEVRAQYLKLVVRHHPDKSKAASDASGEVFLRLQAAYEVLGDPVERRRYERFLRERAELGDWQRGYRRRGRTRAHSTVNAGASSSANSRAQNATETVDDGNFASTLAVLLLLALLCVLVVPGLLAVAAVASLWLPWRVFGAFCRRTRTTA